MVVYEISAPVRNTKNILNPSKIKDSQTTTCTFCSIKEEPLIESKANWRLFKANLPYLPQHCIIAPKEHIPALHKTQKNRFNEIFSGVKKILQIFPSAIALYDFGNVAGQSLSHAHVHILCSKIEEYKYLQLKSSANIIADPLSVPLLIESGLLTISDGYNISITRVIHENDLYDYIKNTTIQIFDGFLRLLQSRMEGKIENYGYHYHNIERLKWLYGVSAANLNDIEFLLQNKVTEGIGINWMISNHKDNLFKVQFIPRATSVCTNSNLQKIRGVEIFHQTLISHTNLHPEIEKEWLEMEYCFYSLIKKEMKTST